MSQSCKVEAPETVILRTLDLNFTSVKVLLGAKAVVEKSKNKKIEETLRRRRGFIKKDLIES
jgi:hypothetical protein